MGGRTVPVLQNTLISKMVKIGDLGSVRSNRSYAHSPRLTVVRFCIIDLILGGFFRHIYRTLTMSDPSEPIRTGFLNTYFTM